MKYQKIIKKYSKIRGMTDGYAKTAIRYYKSLEQTDKNLMLEEFEDYIEGVQSGRIVAEPVPTPK